MLMNSNAVELLGTAYKCKKRNEICQCAFTTCLCYIACGCIEDIKEMYQKAYVSCAALNIVLLVDVAVITLPLLNTRVKSKCKN